VILAQEGLVDLSHMFISGETLSEEVLSLAIAGEVGTLRHGVDGSAAGSPPKTLLELVNQWGQHRLGSDVSLHTFERQLLTDAVERANGNLTSAARSLGISRAQLAYRLQRDVEQ
jgi:two-component system response regulator HydG